MSLSSTSALELSRSALTRQPRAHRTLRISVSVRVAMTVRRFSHRRNESAARQAASHSVHKLPQALSCFSENSVRVELKEDFPLGLTAPE